MPWKTESIMSQRLKFIEEVLLGQDNIASLCRKYAISRTLGYHYIKRYKQEGSSGLANKSRRPKSSPEQTPAAVEQLIVQARKSRPQWGARKLERILIQSYPDVDFPALSTINTILKRHHLIDKEESLKRQALCRFEREKPNELWQMDFKGYFNMTDRKRCYPLTILDDCSRFSIGMKALPGEKGGPVQLYLEHLFREVGLPEQINVDNGNPWGHSCNVKHTYLTVWLLRLGIHVSHSRPRHPQTNGKLERFHRTLKLEAFKKEKFHSLSHVQTRLDEWRTVYNYERPHEALGMKTPAQCYTNSSRVFPTKLPTIEYDADTEVRRVRGNGFISFENKAFCIGKPFKGFYVAIKPAKVEGDFLVYLGKNVINTISFSNQ